VAVHNGRTVYVGISDGVLHTQLDQPQDRLNACIFNAFSTWQAQLVDVPPVTDFEFPPLPTLCDAARDTSCICTPWPPDSRVLTKRRPWWRR
jgi:hypothetical protein